MSEKHNVTRVRATERGIYAGIIREPGDEFDISIPLRGSIEVEVPHPTEIGKTVMAKRKPSKWLEPVTNAPKPKQEPLKPFASHVKGMTRKTTDDMDGAPR